MNAAVSTFTFDTSRSFIPYVAPSLPVAQPRKSGCEDYTNKCRPSEDAAFENDGTAQEDRTNLSKDHANSPGRRDSSPNCVPLENRKSMDQGLSDAHPSEIGPVSNDTAAGHIDDDVPPVADAVCSIGAIDGSPVGESMVEDTVSHGEVQVTKCLPHKRQARAVANRKRKPRGTVRKKLRGACHGGLSAEVTRHKLKQLTLFLLDSGQTMFAALIQDDLDVASLDYVYAVTLIKAATSETLQLHIISISPILLNAWVFIGYLNQHVIPIDPLLQRSSKDHQGDVRQLSTKPVIEQVILDESPDSEIASEGVEEVNKADEAKGSRKRPRVSAKTGATSRKRTCGSSRLPTKPEERKAVQHALPHCRSKQWEVTDVGRIFEEHDGSLSCELLWLPTTVPISSLEGRLLKRAEERVNQDHGAEVWRKWLETKGNAGRRRHDRRLNTLKQG